MRNWIGAILSFLFTACGPVGVETITIKGSDTEVNLALELAESYMSRDSLISIAVTGGGSGYGIASLINNKTDIANSSRSLKDSELGMLKDAGIDFYTVVFAMDALAIVTHPSVSLTSIKLEDLGNIYKGKISNWKTIGGPDMPISLYGRQSNSGTFVFFRERIVRDEYARSLKEMNGTAQIIEAIKTDPGGIGYVGIGYIVDREGRLIDGINVLSINENNIEISPLNTEAINQGRYPITRPLYQFINRKPEGKLLDFLRFELSKQGQQLVLQNGYFPIQNEYKIQNTQKIPGL